MAEQSPRHHRHHKEHKVRRAPQAHAGGGRPHAEGSGPQLPEYHYSVLPGSSRILYSPGWKFNRLTPDRTALLISGGGFALMILCLALAKLLAG